MSREDQRTVYKYTKAFISTDRKDIGGFEMANFDGQNRELRIFAVGKGRKGVRLRRIRVKKGIARHFNNGLQGLRRIQDGKF